MAGALCSFTTIEPGKNKQDDYWKIQNACDHTDEALLLFEYAHRKPETEKPVELVAIFDGSSNHCAGPADVLHVGAGVNLNPGGLNAPGSPPSSKNPQGLSKMRDGLYLDPHTSLQVKQTMHRQAKLPDETKKCPGRDGSIFKGMREIVTERSILTPAEMKNMCAKCTTKQREGRGMGDPLSCTPGDKCCFANVLKCQPDFAEQKSRLQEVVERASHTLLMLPICHPELNPIEDFWNAYKRYTRAVCDYDMKGLRANVPESFLSVKKYWWRKSFEMSDRYLAVYMMEVSAMPFALREFMVKSWKCHRGTKKTLEQVISFAFERLQSQKEDLRRRNAKSNIDPVKMERVAGLLDDINSVISDIPDAKLSPGCGT